MEPDTWQDLKALMERASDLPETQWRQFAEQNCSNDELRDELLALLKSARDLPTDFLVSPVAPPDTEEVIGGYTLGPILGTGGMGTVYEATQDSPRRTVALKLMRSVGLGPQQARRLEAEAEILGQLQHPGIARVHAAGTQEVRGVQVPWFAMELVAGAMPITAFAERSKLDVRARMHLFLKVCAAVQHAHTKGVIHRDLKPGNILVGEDGEPRVIDFGVARATGENTSESLRTQAGELLGTLAYMSPEQCRGDSQATDTRSDVYALGVVLYELLVGYLPFDVVGLSYPEALRVIDEDGPKRVPELHGDLEAIVLKALEKEPARRYPSVQAFADDVERNLRNEPIHARPPSLSYQLRLFARRHRIWVTAASAILITLAVATIVSVNWAIEASARASEAEAARKVADEQREAAEAARMVATEEREAADGTLAMLMGAIIAANPMLQPRDIRMSELLERLQPILAQDAPARVRARLHHVFSSSYSGTGRHKLAIEHATKALAAIEEIPGGDDEIRHTVLQVRSISRTNLGRHAAAEQDLRDALNLVSRVPSPHAAEVATLSALAGVQSRQRQWVEAERTLEQALQVADEHGVGGYSLAQTCANFGTVHFRSGNTDRAEKLWKRALALYADETWDDHPLVVQVRSNYGLVLQRRGETDAAAAMFQQARDSARQRYGNDSMHVANAQSKIGFLHLELGDYAAADDALAEGLRIRRAVHGDDARYTAKGLQECGYLRLYEQRYDEAAALLEQALTLHRAGLPANDPDMAATRLLLGRALMRADRHLDARPHLEAALQVRKQVFGNDSVPTTMARNALGWCLLRCGETDTAERMMRATYPIIEAKVGRRHIETLAARERMAELCERTGKPAEAANWRDPNPNRGNK